MRVRLLKRQKSEGIAMNCHDMLISLQNASKVLSDTFTYVSYSDFIIKMMTCYLVLRHKLFLIKCLGLRVKLRRDHF
jgi:hypothetical protein